MKALLDKHLTDELDNYCRVTVFGLAHDTFEAYFHDFNQHTPRRFVGTAGQVQLHVDLWLEQKRGEGFNDPQSERP